MASVKLGKVSFNLSVTIECYRLQYNAVRLESTMLGL